MKFVVLLVALAVLVAKSFALECYICDSTFDHNCHNMYDRNVRTETCDDSRMVGYQRAVCLKTVSFEYGNRKTIRECSRAGPRKDPCNDRRNVNDVSVCEICDHHLCNASVNLMTSFWATVLPVAAILTIKRFF